MTLESARDPEHCLLECLAGSKAYGLDTPESDTDWRGVFVQPARRYYGFEPLEQVHSEYQDEIFYEVGRFVDLLRRNNPNILELLLAPTDCVRWRHPTLDSLRPEWVMSKLCRETFAGYAVSQIKRARGLNKKIVNPQPAERRGVLEFCHVMQGQGSVPLTEWLMQRGISQDRLGLSAVPHARDLYGMYLDETGTLEFRGVLSEENHTEVRLTSIPRNLSPVAWMNFNKDGFKKHCREWQEYWTWVGERNEARYQATEKHGRGYDAKNLMHTFRLLDAAEEIATEGRFSVRVKNREALWRIRRGEFSYDDLLGVAEERIAKIDALFDKSTLPERPDNAALERWLIAIREEWYGGRSARE